VNQTADKTVIAIDYGSRRIGLAKSDPLGVIASALQTLEVRSDEKAVKAMEKIIHEYQPTALVIGYPLLASGDRSDKCDEVDHFVEKLKRVFSGPIFKVDEHASSVEASSVIHAHGKRIGKDKKRVDRLAAVIILQRYLDGLYEK